MYSKWSCSWSISWKCNWWFINNIILYNGIYKLSVTFPWDHRYGRSVVELLSLIPIVTILRPRQNGHHFADIILNAFSWMKRFNFLFKCHWNVLLRVYLTIHHICSDGLAPIRWHAIIWTNDGLSYFNTYTWYMVCITKHAQPQWVKNTDIRNTIVDTRHWWRMKQVRCSVIHH